MPNDHCRWGGPTDSGDHAVGTLRPPLLMHPGVGSDKDPGNQAGASARRWPHSLPAARRERVGEGCAGSGGRAFWIVAAPPTRAAPILHPKTRGRVDGPGHSRTGCPIPSTHPAGDEATGQDRAEDLGNPSGTVRPIEGAVPTRGRLPSSLFFPPVRGSRPGTCQTKAGRVSTNRPAPLARCRSIRYSSAILVYRITWAAWTCPGGLRSPCRVVGRGLGQLAGRGCHSRFNVDSTLVSWRGGRYSGGQVPVSDPGEGPDMGAGWRAGPRG
jgi:hypothetical protein